MKRKDLKISAATVMQYCERENRFQKSVYAKKVKEGKMNPKAANVNYAIVQDLHQIAKALHQRNIGWNQFLKMVDDLPVMPPQK